MRGRSNVCKYFNVWAYNERQFYVLAVVCCALQLTELKVKLRRETSESTDHGEVKQESPISESSEDGKPGSCSESVKDDPNPNPELPTSPAAPPLPFLYSSCSPSSPPPSSTSRGTTAGKWYHHHQVRMEEHHHQSGFISEESCNFFSVDQPPTLHWYFPWRSRAFKKISLVK